MKSMKSNGWAFIMPAMVMIGLFMIYPILSSLWMSLQTGRGMNLSFGGFDNLLRLTEDPVFLQALLNTGTFLVVQVPIMIVLALLMATLLNNPDLKFRGLLRTAIFLPCVTSLVAYAILFKSMFALDGVVNQTLIGLYLIDQPIPWLSDPFWAKVLVIIGITWRWTGYNMIFYLAALQNIDRSIYEAARVDGVPPRAVFFRLTIPMLKPVILFTCVMSTIGTLHLMGMSEEYFREYQAGTFALESHIQYLAEVLVGKNVTVRTRLLDSSKRMFHFMHFLINDDDHMLSSTCEFIGAHMDLEKRCIAPMPPHIQLATQEVCAEHAQLAWKAPTCGIMKPV